MSALMSQKSILALMLLSIPLSGMGIDIYTPSLPTLVYVFNTSSSLVKFTLPLYFLGFSGGQLVTGPLSDSYGRRKILLLGLLVFALVSFLAATSNSIYTFLLMRFLQGLVVTIPVIVAKSMATDCFLGKNLARVSTYLVMAWSVGPVVAPVIGAHLQTAFSWRANFYFLAFYALAIFLLAIMFLPETNKNIKILNIYKVVLNYKAILYSSKFIACVMCLSFSYSQIVIFNLEGPFLLQNILHCAIIDYGHLALLIGFACFLGGIVNRIISEKIDAKKIVMYGIHSMLFLSILFWLLNLNFKLSIEMLAIPVFLIFFLVGITYPNISAFALSVFPEMAGCANAIMGFITIAGVALVATLASLHTSSTLLPFLSFSILLNGIMLLVFWYFVYKRSFSTACKNINRSL